MLSGEARSKMRLPGAQASKSTKISVSFSVSSPQVCSCVSKLKSEQRMTEAWGVLERPTGEHVFFFFFRFKPHFDKLLPTLYWFYSLFVLTIWFFSDLFFFFKLGHLKIYIYVCLSHHRTGKVGSLMAVCQPRLNLWRRYFSEPQVRSFVLSVSKAACGEDRVWILEQ